MAVLSEEKVLDCLDRCLSLLKEILPVLQEKGTEEASGDPLESFKRFVEELAREKENDSYLSDESWDWIWKGKPSYNYLQLYGRLAWIHYQLFQLL